MCLWLREVGVVVADFCVGASFVVYGFVGIFYVFLFVPSILFFGSSYISLFLSFSCVQVLMWTHLLDFLVWCCYRWFLRRCFCHSWWVRWCFLRLLLCFLDLFFFLGSSYVFLFLSFSCVQILIWFRLLDLLVWFSSVGGSFCELIFGLVGSMCRYQMELEV